MSSKNTSPSIWSTGIVKKVSMALTGLFLITFITAHLAGNLQLLMGDAGKLQFNTYAKFMTSFPLIKILSYVTYASILAHAAISLALTRKNQAARSVAYSGKTLKPTSAWSSRNMGILGTIILVFIVLHMKQFWYVMHWGNLPIDENGNTDLYTVVAQAYTQWWYVLLYLISMVAVGYHLHHGFASAFQTLGLGQKKYFSTIQFIGKAYAIIVAILFAIIPVVMFLNN
jgi:succinate dehydrogenase / fumarate reductase, cytochrome b subunit